MLRPRKGLRKSYVVTSVLMVALSGLVLKLIQRVPRGEAWERWPNADKAGYSASGLDEVLAYTRTLGTTGLMVVSCGKELLQYGDVEARGYLAGGRFAIMALAYGAPVADGTVDLGKTLDELGIDDRPPLLPIEKKATLRDLLTHRSGVYHETPWGRNAEGTPARGSVEPGSYFYDHSWGGFAARGIFELLTGRDLLQVIGEDLAAPLGLQDFKWWRQPPGHDRSRSEFTAFNLYMSTRDIARFGQLMLQDGVWKDRQLVPAEWVDRITTIVTPPDELHPVELRDNGLGAGYDWWAWYDPDPDGPYAGAYTYLGAYGQYLSVLPSLHMVVAHQVYAGWYGAPRRSVAWTEYVGILDRLVAARRSEVDLTQGVGEPTRCPSDS